MNTIKPRGGEHFHRVPSVDIPRSKFDLSHGHKTTFDSGFLIPIMNMDLLPGDSIKCTAKQLVRMTTPIVPFMDRLRCSYFFFAVPKRLVWSNFEDYITGSHNGRLGTNHTVVPQHVVTHDAWTPCGIYDYMGIPRPAVGKSLSVSALPLRAMNLIYNSWFRDENLIDEIPLELGDTDTGNSYALQRRGKRKDYFTSSLPFLQKGPDVSLPLGSVAPVRGNGMTLGLTDGVTNFGLATASGTSSMAHGVNGYGTPVNTTYAQISGRTVTAGVTTDPDNSGLVADLSEATAATVNSLREAFAVQHQLERLARCGSRYVEVLDGVFGVTSPDFRLQRPEYIGGGRVEFDVNTVAQTSATASGIQTPQGNLAAFASSVGSVGFQYSAVEHCILIGLVCVTSDNTYQQGLDRMWTRKTRMDEFFPEFSHLGEQPVYEREIFATGDPEVDDRVFGYQERYSEYRYMPSRITGKLRSTDEQSLDYWHLAQVFDNPPSLSKEFIEENPPIERVLAVQNEPQFVSDMWFDMQAIRPLPVYSVPSLIDHF